MSAGGRKRRGHEEEHENHERWAVSYADMMTVLLALFIVLYAMSAVDQQKFEELRQSLAIGFGHQGASIIEGSTGAMQGQDSFEVAPDFTGVAGEGMDGTPQEGGSDTDPNYIAAVVEYEDLSEAQSDLEERLAASGLSANVTFQIDERGLIVGLVGSNVFFAADDAVLTPVARRVVDTLAGPLREEQRALSVEGHANVLPSSNYPTNWELSSARATQVLRRFVESGGIPGAEIAAVGFGDSRPSVEGMSSGALAQNRRVDIVVRSEVSEEVRALLPEIARAVEDGDITHESLRQQIAAARQEQGAGSL